MRAKGTDAVPNLLLAFLVGAAALAFLWAVMRWAARLEARGQERQLAKELMKRVYWTTRASETDLPPYRRRWDDGDEPDR